MQIFDITLTGITTTLEVAASAARGTLLLQQARP